MAVGGHNQLWIYGGTTDGRLKSIRYDGRTPRPTNTQTRLTMNPTATRLRPGLSAVFSVDKEGGALNIITCLSGTDCGFVVEKNRASG